MLTLPTPPDRVHAGDVIALIVLAAVFGVLVALSTGCGDTAGGPAAPVVALGDVDLAAGAELQADGDTSFDVCGHIVVLVYGQPVDIYVCEVILDLGEDGHAPCTIATLEMGAWGAGGALPIGPEVCQQRFGSFRAVPFSGAEPVAAPPYTRAMVDGGTVNH